MWESPIYKFRTKIANKKEILIDVTGSAPTFSEPKKQLENTFKILLDGLKPKNTVILDFGAAKLRNTVYLLKKGYTVYACEFDDLFHRSQQADEFLKEARTYRNFKKLIFPNDFLNSNIKFDAALLINVLNIMPVPIERLLVLTLLRERMKSKGRLLWYTQHGGYSYSDAFARLNDGIVTGKGRKTYHMFYRDFARKEIHDLLKSTGFSFNKDYSFPGSGSNQAYVFNPEGEILVDQTLGLTKLLKKKTKPKLKTIERQTRWKIDEESKKITYESKSPSTIIKLDKIVILESYVNELKDLLPGRPSASKYHQLIFNILKSVFDHSLKNPEMEERLAGGIKRVDITFTNNKEDGFFKRLDDSYHIQCPNIYIECKNYKRDIKNPEFDQISGRLNPRRGQFGILVCRKMKKFADGKKRQDELVRKNEYVIILVDSDIRKMVSYKLQGKESKIDKMLEKKLKEII